MMQQTEITEYATYKAIASRLKDGKNKQVLNRLAEEELVHCNIWKIHRRGDKTAGPEGVVAQAACRVLGFTFTIKLMENRGRGAARLRRAGRGGARERRGHGAGGRA
ncbi:MAG: hypothetical protein ACLVL7_06860 [Anaerotruncus massiliensis (ex Togo et al. 2019)]